MRSALYLASWTAVRVAGPLQKFYRHLLAAGKPRQLALIAVARKLLHAIYGILRTQTTYDGSKLFPRLVAA